MTTGARWTASEARDGWTVQHVDGRRRYTGFTEGEARVVRDALNTVRRVRLTQSMFVEGQSAAVGSVHDFPARDAQQFVSARRAEFVEE